MLDLNLQEPLKIDLEFFAVAANKAYGSDFGKAFRGDSLYHLRPWSGGAGFWLNRANRGTFKLEHDMQTESADQCYVPQNTSIKSIDLFTKDGKLRRLTSDDAVGENLDQLDSRHVTYIAMDGNELQDLADFLAPGANADPMLRKQYESLVGAINLPPLQDMETIRARIAAERKVTVNDFPQLQKKLPSAEDKAQLLLALSGLNKIIHQTTNGAYGAVRMGMDQLTAFSQAMDYNTKQASPEGKRLDAYAQKAELQGLAADMALRTGGTNLQDALPQIVSFTSQIPRCLHPYFELDVDPRIQHAVGGSIMAGRIEGSASRARMKFIDTIQPGQLVKTIADTPRGVIGDDERAALLGVLAQTYGYKDGVQKLSTPEYREAEADAARFEALRAKAGNQGK